MPDPLVQFCICGNKCSFIDIRKGYLKYCSNECATSDPVRCNKIKNTCNEKYGYDSVNQVPSIKLKKIKTVQKNYGVDNVFQSEVIKDKIKSTNLKIYGTENPMQNEEIKAKTRMTNIRIYGHPCPLQNKEVSDKSKQTMIKLYGFDNFAKSDRGRQLCRENFIRMIEIQKLNGETLYGRVGDMERPCLNELQLVIDHNIIRNPQLYGYIPDGHISELNAVIEFDERHHFSDNYITYKPYDIQKDKDYKSYGLHCFRIKKIDWEQNKEDVIRNFKLFIKEIK
jgi:very-short-patch-repair endonuclease